MKANHYNMGNAQQVFSTFLLFTFTKAIPQDQCENSSIARRIVIYVGEFADGSQSKTHFAHNFNILPPKKKAIHRTQ